MDQSRIAVVVVHGVADQQPEDSVRAVSNLFLNLDEGGNPLYRAFRRVPFRIQSRRVRLAGTGKPDCRGNPFARFVRQETRRGAKNGAVGAHHAFLQGQLECYRGEDPDEPYESVRLEGLRQDRREQQIHLYEMYWADLSRLGRGVLRVFGDLYQILLHLPSVGVQNLRAALLEHPRDRMWRSFAEAQNVAAWLLNVPIALVNLLLLALAVTVALAGPLTKIHPGGQAGFAWIVLTAAIGWVACTILYRRERQTPLALIATVLFLAGAGGAAVAYQFGGNIPLFLIWWPTVGAIALAALIAMTLVVKAYDKRRPAAWRWWWVLLAVATALILYSANREWPYVRQPEAGVGLEHLAWLFLLRSVEIGFIITECLWATFYAVALIAHFLGATAVRRDDLRGRRARWTARFTLAISSVAFTLVTLALWAGISAAFTPLIPDPLVPCAQMQIHSWVFRHAVPAGRIGADLVTQAALLLPFKGFFSILALVIAVVGLTPVVLAEVFTPANLTEESKRMGNWLTLANHAALWAGRAVYGSTVFLLPLLLVVRFVLPYLWPNAGTLFATFEGWVSGFMTRLGGAVAGSAVGLFALGRSLGSISRFLAPVDVLLDVDNYMREHPRNQNPTARIFARYASLLRAICLWRDPDTRQPYDAIIVVAHSQGTVITADLLRFLQQEWTQAHRSPDYDPDLLPLLSGTLPVYLFTMGSPLRNLYGRRFPHLYGWAFHDVDAPMSKHTPQDLVPDRTPDPSEMCVQQWVNAFRSGDYVGRFLWRSDLCDYAWLPPAAEPPDKNRPWNVDRSRPVNVSADAGGRRREICIGAGAHTHYWDDTAPEIAFELDRLIRNAIGTAHLKPVCVPGADEPVLESSS